MRPPPTVRAAVSALLLLLLLPDRGLGLPSPSPSPAPAADRSGWPNLWGVLRAIRDTTGISSTTSATRKSSSVIEAGSNKTDVLPAPTPTAFASSTQRVSAFGQVANMFLSVRSSLWQLAGTATAATTAASASASAPAPDLEAGASSDVLGKESADTREPEDAPPTPQRQQPPEEPQSFMSSAIERVRDASRTFSEVGRAVGRWGKAMADSVVGSTVNSAVGTVLQVIKGGKQDDDADHVCFPDLGCFSLLQPWTSSKRPLPRMNAPEDIQTRFFLYTRNASAVADAVVLQATGNDTVANATALLKGVRTFFVVHGFNDKTTATWVQDIKDTLLGRMDSNVILVDWAPGAQASRNYLQAASNTRVVGAEMARLLELLAEAEAVAMDSVHVIGHSLGAHAAGYAGKQLAGRLGRITALDAAQPAFEDQAAEVRVAAGDARFVDVVHTNGMPFIPTLGLGVMHPVGDVDFYLNGGTVQPGCFVPKLPAVQSLMDLAALPVSVLGDMLSCSHRRAIEYFTEAVRGDCQMWGRRRAEDNLGVDRDGGDKKSAAAESSSSGSRSRLMPWWPPSGGLGLGGLLAGVFSSGDKPSPTKASPTKRSPTKASPTKASPTTEAPSSTGPGRPSSGFSFPLPGFLASIFSSDGRRDAAAAGAAAVPSANKSDLIAKNKAADLQPVEGNGIADSKAVDEPRVPADSRTADSTPVSTSTGSKRSPLPPLPPPSPSPSWCAGDDCLPLGLDADRYNLKGTFDIHTADHAPYCMSDPNEEE